MIYKADMSIFFTNTQTVSNSLYRDVLMLRELSNEVNALAQKQIKPCINPKLLHQVSPKKIKEDPFYRDQYLLNFCKKSNRKIQSLWNWCKRTNDKLSDGWKARLPYTWSLGILQQFSYVKADILAKVNKLLDKAFEFNLINREAYLSAKKLCDYLDLCELMYYSEL